MAAAASSPYNGVMKEMLQSAVQSVQWTYIIFWQLCPQQRVLMWVDGYYNGSIKTRKTVQSVEVSTEEAALSRSEQLRELYDSLASGEQLVTENQQAAIRRPSVALSPEDLTETEWFYLVCISFSFLPGVGLVGEAYAKQQHLWLKDAHEVDSKVFTRSILAKSAHIQTVVCIPLLNGVVELGTTKKVKETIEFIRHVKRLFMIDNDNPILLPPKPALSAHSSNTSLPPQMSTSIKPPDNIYFMDEDVEIEEPNDDDVEEEEENGPDFVARFKEPLGDKKGNNELLQLDMFEEIMLIGSPNDCSSNLNSRFNLSMASNVDSSRVESTPGLSDNMELHNPSSSIQLQESEILAPEDTHYSDTLSTILHSQSNRRPANSHTPSRQNTVTQSSFTTWTSERHQSHQQVPAASNSQLLLKYMLFTVPFLHSTIKSVDGDASESVASRLRKTTSHDEELISGNHVLAERRRREKLNERFGILTSLVPLVTKMDKASILGDTIEYVKQLRKKIQELEARGCHDALDSLKVAEKRKFRVVDGGGRPSTAVQVEVSIIESDALVELQCKQREGLLLDVMKKLRELGVEITAVQSCVNGGMCTAEMRAKVKGNNGKKISIMQVKKAINQIIYLL